jgi:hypothetical protein
MNCLAGDKDNETGAIDNETDVHLDKDSETGVLGDLAVVPQIVRFVSVGMASEHDQLTPIGAGKEIKQE